MSENEKILNRRIVAAIRTKSYDVAVWRCVLDDGTIAMLPEALGDAETLVGKTLSGDAIRVIIRTRITETVEHYESVLAVVSGVVS